MYPSYIRTPIHDDPSLQGISLEGLIPAEDIEDAARTLTRAALDRPLRGFRRLGARTRLRTPRGLEQTVGLRPTADRTRLRRCPDLAAREIPEAEPREVHQP